MSICSKLTFADSARSVWVVTRLLGRTLNTPRVRRLGLVVGTGTTVFTILAFMVDYYGWRFGDICNYLVSSLVQSVSWRHNTEVREQFRVNFNIMSYRKTEDHPHAEAANNRKQADYAIDDFCGLIGRIPYPISYSKRDKTAGTHFLKSIRDHGFRVSYSSLPDNGVIKMIDVDYYLDMPYYIRLGKPLLLYTVTPDRVAKTWSEGDYRFEEDDLLMQIKGGGSYKHGLWDYNMDSLAVHQLCGTTLCSVETRSVGEDHSVVLIVPETFIPFPFNYLADPAPTLTRRKMCHGGVVMLERVDFDGKKQLSLARSGNTTDVVLESEVWESLSVRYDLSSKPSISDIERILSAVYPKTITPERRAVVAPLIYDIIASRSSPPPKTLTVFRPSPAPYYQATGPLVYEDARATAVQVAPQLGTDAAVTSGASYNNEVAAVIGRVIKVKNSVYPGNCYFKYAREFVELVVPTPNTGVPLSSAQVYENQDKARQRARLDARWSFISTTFGFMGRIFVKREAYNKPTDPRIITQVSDSHNLRLSAYIHAFKKDVMKQWNWYAPGMNPEQISERIVDLCYGKEMICETDFSRFDGTISKWLRQRIEQQVLMRWVNQAYGSDLLGLLQAEESVRCVTNRGVTYTTDGQRLSGSPLTTDGNTLINAFVSYAGYRHDGKQPKEAYAELGLYAGDDGVCAGKGEGLVRAATDLGMSLDLVKHVHGPIHFLGRYFIDPQSGNHASLQDPIRTVAKLHVSVSNLAHYEPTQALVNKAYGYKMMDPAVPLVSDWCSTILRLYSTYTASIDVVDLPYNCIDWDTGELHTWPQPTYTEAVAVIAKLFDTTVGEVEVWITKIQSALRIDDLQQIVKLDLPDTTLECVRSDNIHLVIQPKPKQPPPPKSKTAAPDNQAQDCTGSNALASSQESGSSTPRTRKGSLPTPKSKEKAKVDKV